MLSKAEKTRQFILEKTAPIFNVKGYAGTSLSDMTDATGLTKGSIYGNFENKDEVALAAFDFNLQRSTSRIKNEMQKYARFKDKLLVYPQVYEGLFKDPCLSGGCPILNTATESDDTHPELRKKAVTAIIQWKGSIVGLIEQGITAKEFKKDVNAEATAISIIALIEGGIMMAKLTGKASYISAVTLSVRAMIEGLG